MAREVVSVRVSEIKTKVVIVPCCSKIILSASPTPLVSTNGALHMQTTLVLLNFVATIWASSNILARGELIEGVQVVVLTRRPSQVLRPFASPTELVATLKTSQRLVPLHP